jgi:hypothetical protein
MLTDSTIELLRQLITAELHSAAICWLFFGANDYLGPKTVLQSRAIFQTGKNRFNACTKICNWILYTILNGQGNRGRDIVSIWIGGISASCRI